MLVVLFGLTHASGAAPSALSARHSLESASASLEPPDHGAIGVKSVFRKAGVGRQQDLVRLLTSLSAVDRRRVIRAGLPGQGASREKPAARLHIRSDSARPELGHAKRHGTPGSRLSLGTVTGSRLAMRRWSSSAPSQCHSLGHGGGRSAAQGARAQPCRCHARARRSISACLSNRPPPHRAVSSRHARQPGRRSNATLGLGLANIYGRRKAGSDVRMTAARAARASPRSSSSCGSNPRTSLTEIKSSGPTLHSLARLLHAPAMPSTSLNHPRRLADYSADYRMLILAAMAIVAGTGGAFSAWALLKLIAFATNLFWYGNFSFAAAVSPNEAPLLVLVIPIARRADHRADGAVRIGQDPRPRHSRGDRDDPLRRKQAVAQGRAAEAAVLGGLDRQRRAVRRRGADHHDRRRDRLAVRPAVPPQRRRAQDAAGRRRDGGHDRDFRHARSRRSCWRSSCCCSNGSRAASCRW